ncbi:MAG: bifunctional adenosylcobinamide kinase/adenosylcobinamide-phosphate guanylyltransferase [Acidobacteriaceae bacterium]|nr:bifunctional adenosylcobinamide kinase/adenosylcobinamide-phosphate guanylyltransferase [Acidobacteriaceae bacterium]
MVTLILGGARSGKSRLAQRLAERDGRVTFIATAERNEDREMMARIEHHRASRPEKWRTVEEPLDLAAAVESASKDSGAILVDCLTVWLGNLFWRHRDSGEAAIGECARKQLERIVEAGGQAHVILVSNETGCGIVPEAAVARAFRDAQGLLNQWAAQAADRVVLTVAGLPLYLKGQPVEA